VRVLHVAPFLEPPAGYGGMARAAAGMCGALARRGHEVTVATTRLDPSHADEERAGRLRIRRFASPPWLTRRLFPFTPALWRFLTEQLPSTDVAHVHGHRNGLALMACRALSAAGVPWVLQPHGTFPRHGQRALAKRAFDFLAGDRVVRGCSTLVAVSEAEAADLPRPARRVPNGVELAAPPPARPRAGPPRLLFVGSDAPQKRGQILPQILDLLPEAGLDLVGRFGRRFLARFGRFEERVRARGLLEGADLAAAYAEASLLVHPAVGEAFGLVPFEAALAGTAAVVAGGHGCGEWFGRAGGCVVPPDDAAAAAAAVRERLAPGGPGAREARAVAAFARRELTWDRTAAALEELYASLADPRPVPARAAAGAVR
jgi:glycosyltransferase involved in cell wall biosynthesis